ncbi:MAG: uridylate kinase [Betaproteobacteria bacterium]|nr:uridylate kinase [Betaproteobacteria bacterium]
MTLWVVKLGGSLANSPELPRWLDVIATTGAGKVVLVPGGGSWADEVREAQKREGFDDRIAHRKALRAMEQYGKVLAGMRANFVPAAGIAEIHKALRNDQIAVWMPYEMIVADPSIPESWDVTSDSLAAWLAKKLNASALLLVKSLKIDAQPGIEDLVRRGWVDPAFAKFSSGKQFKIVLLGKGDQNAAEFLLTSDDAVKATSHD